MQKQGIRLYGNRIKIVFFAFLFTNTLWGQTDTVFSMPAIEIRATPTHTSAIGTPTQSWNSTQLQQSTAQNIGELLETEGGVFIKNYGLGSLATSTIRGGSAQHTAVLWNGMPLQSPMLGLIDLSLLPLQAGTSVSVQKGANASLWGSGAVGGTISLDHEANFDNTFSGTLRSTVGSFGHWQQCGQFSFGHKNIQARSKFLWQQADNDFYYTVHPDLPKRQQTHARLQQQHFWQDVFWKINAQQQVRVHYWQSRSERQIPPLSTQTRSRAQQQDQSHRALVQWKHTTPKRIWKTKTGFIEEKIDYTDPLSGIDAPTRFVLWMAEGSVQQTWKNHRFLATAGHNYTRARANNYATPPDEHRTTTLASHRYENATWKIQTTLRQEWVNGKATPFVPSVAWNVRVFSFLQWQGKVGRAYRIPTFNERYWQPGGNADLRPEAGWSTESSLVSDLALKNGLVRYTLTGFSRHIDDWIQWTLPDDAPYWSAQNINKVWSRGIEQHLRMQYIFGKWQIQSDARLEHIYATNQVAIEHPATPKGTQLLYTPRRQASVGISVERNAFLLRYQHTFTGERQGVQEVLPDFQVGTLRLQYQAIWEQHQGLFFVNIHNLWNADYTIVERRPMPPTYIRFGVHYSFTKN